MRPSFGGTRGSNIMQAQFAAQAVEKFATILFGYTGDTAAHVATAASPLDELKVCLSPCG